MGTYKIKHSGSASYQNHDLQKFEKKIPPNFLGIYSYSESSIRRLRESELALKGKADILGLPIHMITFTFPASFDNAFRWRCNDRIRKLVRAKKQFKNGGLWCVEKHESGLLHFHYKIICPKNFVFVNKQGTGWLQKQQARDHTAINSYDVSLDAGEFKIYMGLYFSKERQKEVTHTGRLWASWGLDTKPLMVTGDMFNLLDPVTNVKLVDKATGEIKTRALGLASGRKDIASFIQFQKLKK